LAAWPPRPVQIADKVFSAALVVPVVGSLTIGVMARFGSDRIRGLGIPETIAAIL
jgi:hypothetical protein